MNREVDQDFHAYGYVASAEEALGMIHTRLQQHLPVRGAVIVCLGADLLRDEQGQVVGADWPEGNGQIIEGVVGVRGTLELFPRI